jgi:hypothetical protein
VTEADVVRAKMSVQMTQDLIAEKRRKIEYLEGRIHEKVRSSNQSIGKRELMVESGDFVIHE